MLFVYPMRSHFGDQPCMILQDLKDCKLIQPLSFSYLERVFKFRFPIFKKLADNIFNDKLSKEQKAEYFIQAVSSGQAGYVKYLLDTGKVRINELDRMEQFACWIGLRSHETAKILHDNGADANIVNAEGQTPLQQIVTNPPQYIRIREESAVKPMEFKGLFDQREHIQALLAAGAIPCTS